MDYRSTIDFLNQQKNKIIEQWSFSLDQQYPGFYNLHELQTQGHIYLDLIFDIHTPIHLHPIYNKLSYWCKILVEKQVPIVHTSHSSHILRESILDIVLINDLGHVVSERTLSVIRARIDSYERAVIHYYWENARLKMKNQDKKLDELHEDKINLIGKMAASMAHEIRNPLTSIKGFIHLVRGQLPKQALEHVEKYLDIIETEFENIQMQITGFLSFSKKSVVEEKFLDISLEQLMESVLVLVKPRMISENIELIVDFPRDLLLHVQKAPIQQVLSNLINNGIDALKDRHDNKAIKIHSKEDEKLTYLMIANNGPEIPWELRDTLFEPFVTSKSEGTGLGLAICKQIMRKNNGDIDFVSGKDETTFILNFIKQS